MPSELERAVERVEAWAGALDPGRERYENDHPALKEMRARADDLRLILSALNSPKVEVTELLEAAKAFARQFPTNPTGAAISVDFTRLSKAARAFALAALAKPDQGEQM